MTLALGSQPKASAWKGAGSECNHESPTNAKQCEGMNPHTPKWTFTLGVGGSVKSQTPSSSIVFIFEFIFESFKEFRGYVIAAPRKHGQYTNSKPTNAPLRK
jgi:hypothetical protein